MKYSEFSIYFESMIEVLLLDAKGNLEKFVATANKAWAIPPTDYMLNFRNIDRTADKYRIEYRDCLKKGKEK